MSFICRSFPYEIVVFKRSAYYDKVLIGNLDGQEWPRGNG
jgi:hypothetical protein